ncbi:hypothetical protein VOLCADRAFT_92233 [Volvox carteri f. nagariensis]|uniref:Pherophorin domain-containing protein n=1 Tax=Volvox carteri f. nagariensis TaxID=3068 RepID=D8TZ42_VOLCA|nr:uncharacterized protein VOLCADRAFT_92233 [Volvox carteri f. nagariensis]EFJ47115.1 hypothetical protein VOLCADRAFT_92233 [Volvox carteri f. nagariensis]|eukprot:XP_002951664.1 hypothetical protein VOLCADRAFT_92233 [Volvox carteri f. nagariensis]
MAILPFWSAVAVLLLVFCSIAEEVYRGLRPLTVHPGRITFSLAIHNAALSQRCDVIPNSCSGSGSGGGDGGGWCLTIALKLGSSTKGVARLSGSPDAPAQQRTTRGSPAHPPPPPPPQPLPPVKPATGGPVAQVALPPPPLSLLAGRRRSSGGAGGRRWRRMTPVIVMGIPTVERAVITKDKGDKLLRYRVRTRVITSKKDSAKTAVRN